MSLRRPLVFLLTLGAGLLAPAAAASAAVPLPSLNQPGFGIAPARQEVIGTPPLELTSTKVLNGTSKALQVTDFPVLLKQALTGAFYFSPSPQALNASKLVLTAEPSSFALSPGQSQLVGLHWNLLPRHQPWVAVGVIYQGVPSQQAGPVHVITRLLGIDFLRLPGNFPISGNFTGLFAQQGGPQVLRFVPRVENTGQMFAAPSAGSLVIRNSSGQRVFSQLWAGSVVLPGASVDFPVLVKHVLPAGRYTATVAMNLGGTSSRTVPFTLIGPNQLPTPAIAIQNLSAAGVVGSHAQVKAKIISDGTAPATVTVHLFLGTQTARNALATKALTYRNLAPGRVIRLSVPLGASLKTGSYRAILTWTDAIGAPHTLESDFRPTQGRSFLQKLWDFIKDNLALFIGLAVIAVFLVVARIYNRQRQRQRELAAELAAARAAIARGPAARREVAVAEPRDGRVSEPDFDGHGGEEPEPEPDELEHVAAATPVASTPESPPERPPKPPAPEPAPTPSAVEPPAAPSPPPADDGKWIPPWER